MRQCCNSALSGPWKSPVLTRLPCLVSCPIVSNELTTYVLTAKCVFLSSCEMVWLVSTHAHSVVGNTCSLVLEHSIAGNTCSLVLEHSIVGSTCSLVLEHSIAGNTCSFVLEHSIVGSTCSLVLEHSVVGSTWGAVHAGKRIANLRRWFLTRLCLSCWDGELYTFFLKAVFASGSVCRLQPSSLCSSHCASLCSPR